MDYYNILLGLILLLLGIVSLYTIIRFHHTKASDPNSRPAIDHNDLWLYIAAAGGILGGNVVFIREFMNL